MRIHRFLSLTDLVVALVVAIAIFLPKRAFQAVDAYEMEADAHADLAAAEAVAMAHPDDGGACEAESRRLADASMTDWAVESARDCAGRATPATRWRADVAVSEAYGKRIELEDAYAWAKRALDDCRSAGAATCPGWEQLKLELHVSFLEGGIQSGIDPRSNPSGFRDAAEGHMDMIDVHGATPGIGSGSGGH